jgi:hypothetical protein
LDGHVSSETASARSREAHPDRAARAEPEAAPFAVIVLLVLLVVLLGIPLGMPMSGASMCPECGPAAASGAMCAALLASVVLLVQRRASRIFVDRYRQPILITTDVLERPPRFSS